MDLLHFIEGLCTYDLLHQARVHRYGDNYHLSTGYLDNPITMDTHGVTSYYRPPTQYESLVTLDRTGHVPNDSPQTLEFEGHARRFTHWLVDTYWAQVRPTWLIDFHLELIGSFPCDTKVGDMDEFDYLCMVEVDPDCWGLEVADGGEWEGKLTPPGGETFHWDFYSHCCDMLQSVREPTPSTPLIPHVSKVYQHGPATCVELSWRCIHGHNHELGLDVSLATQVSDTRLADTIRAKLTHLPRLGSHLEPLADKQLLVYKVYHRGWPLSTTSYDTPLFDLVEKTTTKHIKLLFRCLKLLTKEVLPKGFIYNWKTGTNRRLSGTVSSHILKSALLQTAIHHTTTADWEVATLGDRLVDVLNTLGVKGQEGTYDRWPVCRDVITCGQLGEKSPDKDLFTKPSVIDNIQALASCITHHTGDVCSVSHQGAATGDVCSVSHQGAATGDVCCVSHQGAATGDVCSVSHQGAATAVTDEGVVYIKCGAGLLHAAVLCKDLALPGFSPPSPLYLYTPQPATHTPHHTHPLIQWCRGYIDHLYTTHRGVDFTHIPTQHTHHVWGLVYAGTLTTHTTHTTTTATTGANTTTATTTTSTATTDTTTPATTTTDPNTTNTTTTTSTTTPTTASTQTTRVADYEPMLCKLRRYITARGDAVWRRYLEGSRDDRPPSHVTQYLEQAPPVELDVILECGLYELSVEEREGMDWDEWEMETEERKREILGRLGDVGGGFVHWWLSLDWFERDAACVYLAVHNLLIQ